MRYDRAPTGHSMNRITFSLRLTATAFIVFMLASCGETPPAPPPPPVTIAKPVKQKVVDRDEYVGRFIAVDSVEIRARVSGYLDSIDFTAGQMVKKGDLLFTIDKRPFQNAVDQAKGTLAQARANLAFAEADLERGQKLLADKTISQQVYEQRTQTKKIAEASVASNEAALRQAELDLQFTELRAPVTGRIGDRRVSIGNLVTGGTTGNTTLLATIVSIDPIRFEFTADEGAYLRYERISQSAREASDRYDSLPVKLKLLDEPDFVHEGRIDFVDNVIDQSSGTIRGRAVFANPTALFTPGMFGRIQVPASREYEALLVPDSSIGSEQIRKFVFVVDADHTVKQKFVTLGELHGKLRVVKGIDENDDIIVNGLMRARPGVKVTPLTEEQVKQMQQKQGQPGQQKAAPSAAPKKDQNDRAVPESGSKASEQLMKAPAEKKAEPSKPEPSKAEPEKK
jgi:RND family efflux transporter MFP subunit